MHFLEELLNLSANDIVRLVGTIFLVFRSFLTDKKMLHHIFLLFFCMVNFFS